MALQIRRGPTTDRVVKVFEEGEIIYDTDLQEVFIGDGTSPGGKTVSTYTDNQSKDAAASTLTHNTGHSNISFAYDDVTKRVTATVALDGTYNDVVQDTTPELGGNLLLNGKDIALSSGAVIINGTTGAITANVTGNVTGDLTGDVYAADGTNKVLESGTNGTNAVFTGSVTGTVSSLSNHTTDTLVEGTTNRYFTNQLARGAISVSGSLSYDTGTGVISYTTPDTDGITEGTTNKYFTNQLARGAISVSGSIDYDISTGVISYTTPDTDGITEGTTNRYFTNQLARDAISSGIGIEYDANTGVFSLPQSVAPTNSVTFANVDTSGFVRTTKLVGAIEIINTDDESITGALNDTTIYSNIKVNGLISSATEINVTTAFGTEDFTFFCDTIGAAFNVPLKVANLTTTQRNDLDSSLFQPGTVIFNTTIQRFQGWVNDLGLAVGGSSNSTPGWVNFTVTTA